jgi:hypothetical protein
MHTVAIEQRQNQSVIPSRLEKARRKFLNRFPGGFRDETYLAWERDYKWEAHKEWEALLSAQEMEDRMAAGEWQLLAQRAVKIESGRSLLFSFEKMALRDAVRSREGARLFVEGLHQLLHGKGALQTRFESWVAAIEVLPRKQTRVLTWPLVTVFGFIAQPRTHIFLKPNTTREAFRKLGLTLPYKSRPNWDTYSAYLGLASEVKRALRQMRPRDLIDIQSFLWVQGSEEYA